MHGVVTPSARTHPVCLGWGLGERHAREDTQPLTVGMQHCAPVHTLCGNVAIGLVVGLWWCCDKFTNFMGKGMLYTKNSLLCVCACVCVFVCVCVLGLAPVKLIEY